MGKRKNKNTGAYILILVISLVAGAMWFLTERSEPTRTQRLNSARLVYGLLAVQYPIDHEGRYPSPDDDWSSIVTRYSGSQQVDLRTIKVNLVDLNLMNDKERETTPFVMSYPLNAGEPYYVYFGNGRLREYSEREFYIIKRAWHEPKTP